MLVEMVQSILEMNGINPKELVEKAENFISEFKGIAGSIDARIKRIEQHLGIEEIQLSELKDVQPNPNANDCKFPE